VTFILRNNIDATKTSDGDTLQKRLQVTFKLVMPTAGSRRYSGSEFQTVGPAEAKAREPNVLRQSVDGQRQVAEEATGNVGDHIKA